MSSIARGLCHQRSRAFGELGRYGLINADVDASTDGSCAACDDQEAGLDTTVCSFVCNVAGLTAIEARSEHGFSAFASVVRAPMAEQGMQGLSGPPAKLPPRIYL